MIRKKICLLGAYAVGKTSLVARFVHGIYSSRYHTTMGVKIDKRSIAVDGVELSCVLWDIAGEDAFHSVAPSYLRGMSGYLLVVDGTRRATLATARELKARAEGEVGAVPFVLVVNKQDLRQEWEVEEDELARLRAEGWVVLAASAKTGQGVEEAFGRLARALLQVEA